MSLDKEPITTSKTSVLVHGAWHRGHAWKAVRTRLEASGHRVFTPDLAGHTPGAKRAGLTLNDLVTSVGEMLVEQDLREVVLVGHSMAGIIIPKVTEQAPDRIAHLIFHDALVLQDGQAPAEVLPGLAEHILPLAQAEADFSLPPQWDLFQALRADPLAGNSPLASLERARQIFTQNLVPEPMQPMFEPVPMSSFLALVVPSSYLLCRQDAVFGADFWRSMAGRLPGCRMIEMDGGHEALYTRPDDLADTILEASQHIVTRAA